MKISKKILLGAALLSLAFNAMALDASSLKVKVYAVMLSTSSLCTNAITINTTSSVLDFLTIPTLGSGNPPDGTYQCVIIKMSDQIKFTPSTSSGSCTAGTEYTNDVCQTGDSMSVPDVAGSTQCHGSSTAPVDDTVYLYLTTNSYAGTGSGGGGSTFTQPPTATSLNGLHLAAPFVVSGITKSKFVVNATGQVDGTGSSCNLNPPTFDFKTTP